MCVPQAQGAAAALRPSLRRQEEEEDKVSGSSSSSAAKMEEQSVHSSTSDINSEEAVKTECKCPRESFACIYARSHSHSYTLCLEKERERECPFRLYRWRGSNFSEMMRTRRFESPEPLDIIYSYASRCL